MRALSRIGLTKWGDRKGLINFAESFPRILAFTWMDRDCRYFFSSASSPAAGKPFSSIRWRQHQAVEGNLDPERVELTVPRPRRVKSITRRAVKLTVRIDAVKTTWSLNTRLGQTTSLLV